MRSIGDPDFVYRPETPEQRRRKHEAAVKRLGIPPGYCRIYAALLPVELREQARAIVERRRKLKGDAVAWQASLAIREIWEAISS